MKKRIAAVLTAITLVCSLSGCGPLSGFEDEIADEYLEDMLDAIEDEDVDDAFDLFIEGKVDYDEFEDVMEVLHDLWNGEKYTYSLIYVGNRVQTTSNGIVFLRERKYKVETEDRTYTIRLTYVKDEGMYNFDLSYKT